jgi:hypothetical protein
MATWFSNWTDWGHLSLGSAMVYWLLAVGILGVLELLVLRCFDSEEVYGVVFVLFAVIGIAITIIILYAGTK